MSAASGPRAIGGVALIALCFLGSAALRLAESGSAIAGEIGALASLSEENALQCVPTAESDALLEAIRARETQLGAEEARLADRAQVLKVAETKLTEQLAAFETARKNLEDTLAMADKAAERDIERMTTVYESMKPTDAAKIFERMDVAFAAGLLARMRPESAAAVLTGMNADAAYAVTVTIASRNAGVPTE